MGTHYFLYFLFVHTQSGIAVSAVCEERRLGTGEINGTSE